MGTALDFVALTDRHERVRTALHCHLRGENSMRRLCDDGRIGLSTSALSRRLQGRSVADDTDLISRLARAVGEERLIQFARRTSDESFRRTESLAAPHWWPHLRDNTFHSPIGTVVAGNALLAYAGQAADAQRRTRDTMSFEERRAVARVGYGLCRLATGGYGFAGEALDLLARLAPLVDDQMKDFMLTSPKGEWIGRAADRAIRRFPDDLLVEAFSNVATVHANALSPDNPSRMVSWLRLLRRAAHARPEKYVDRVAEIFISVATDRHYSVRLRRFCVWVIPECEARGSRQAAAFLKHDHLELRDDRQLRDVIDAVDKIRQDRMVEDAALDLYSIALYDRRGQFKWAIDGATRRQLDRCLDRVTSGRGHWRNVPARVLPRLADALHETLVHPGFIRAQAGADLLLNCGPDTRRAAAESALELLESLGDGRSGSGVDYHSGVMEAAIYLLGRLRVPATGGRLARLAPAYVEPHIRASAIWALSDIIALEEAPVAPDLITAVLETDDLSAVPAAVLRSVLHFAGVCRLTDLEERIERVVGTSEVDMQTRHWAQWALLAWDPHNIGLPPQVFLAP